MQRTEDSLRDLWDNIKCTSIQIIGIPEEEENKKGCEEIFEKIIVENFPNMEKEVVSSFHLFTLVCSSEVISAILSSSSLIHSSASENSCLFSILVPRFLIIFTIIILNYFSGSLPISCSFIWTSVFLVCSSSCIVFLCLLIIIL